MRMDLIRRSQTGDEAAFAALFEQYKNLVYRTACQMTGSEREAEDVLQDVFVKVHRSLSSYDASRGAFTTWLHRITVNECLNRGRKRRPDPLPPDEVAATHNGRSPSPERALETHQTVRTALGVLSGKLRAVVVLRYGWDMTYEEIGDVLGIPIGTVKSRMYAALHQMRDAIEDEGPAVPVENREVLE